MIVRAAERTQVWVVTHSERLAAAFEACGKVRPHTVIKRNGETWIEGLNLGGEFRTTNDDEMTIDRRAMAVIDLSSNAATFPGCTTRGCSMTFQPGDVVFLKSGGQSMTVAAITDENVECIWLGEEGDLFRQAIPAVALTSAGDVAEEEEDEAA